MKQRTSIMRLLTNCQKARAKIDHCRRIGLFSTNRFRASGAHRAVGGRLVDGGYGALCRTHRRWRLSESCAARGFCHDNNAQKSARAARRRDSNEIQIRESDQFGHFSRNSGRPADACDCSQGARILAETLAKRGLRVVSGRTESHLMLIDLRPKQITGKAAEAALGAAQITVNKNAIPNDPESPFVTSGIRLGSPAITTRGFKTFETERVAHLIADILDAPDDSVTLKRVREQVGELTRRFPAYR